MKIQETALPGVVVIEPTIFGDERGYFFETFHAEKFKHLTGEEVLFVQDNQSFSAFGVIRGLHYRRPPTTQAKLVRILKGSVLDVAVDIRTGSPTFGQYVAVQLSAENKKQLFIPRGFAHGFSVLSSEGAEMFYKCDNYYSAKDDGGIRYDDADLAIDWKVSVSPQLISEKDLRHGGLKDVAHIFTYANAL